MSNRYVGQIVTVRLVDGYAFIGIATVSNIDCSHHDINTTQDIFLHKDECRSSLAVGMTVSFDIVPDTKRGDGCYRAQGAVEIVEAELLPSNEPPMQGFIALAPFGANDQHVVVAPTPAQQAMKKVPTELVNKVVGNKPATTIPRDSSVPPNKDELMRLFLMHLFPMMKDFGTDFSLDSDDSTLSAKLAQAAEDQEAMGMTDQVIIMKAEVEKFKSLRQSLNFMIRENLVRRDAIIPIQYLPDFFMAVPVWYHWLKDKDKVSADAAQDNADPRVHSYTHYFCDLFPNQVWMDVFQMFNRRVRTLAQYKGDIIPPHVARRMREATGLFDHVVIMTPYHDVAGRDWNDIKWLRSIDPYVVGFKKGIPYFFILARFSDSGTFPLFNELVADTIQFLTKNKENLAGFNQINNPYWKLLMQSPGMSKDAFRGKNLGTHLQGVTDQLLLKFEARELFDWLRGKHTS